MVDVKGETRISSDARVAIPPEVPDVFVDGYEGVITVNGAVRLHLIRFVLADHDSKSVERRVVGTLSMTEETLRTFHDALGALLKEQAARAPADEE